jgi:alanyl-tRNA synthetase
MRTHPASSEVRTSFLEFFKGRGHTVVESGSLVPSNDPTLTFTNAGMVPFKEVFTGKETRAYTRATSSQKCIRISGKHNDLENVGVTARHHTFFEMLGNFSFGDYFKEEAIVSAWELLTKTWEIPEKHLVISVFGGEGDLRADDEARALWKKVTGFSDERIIGLGMADNFWQMGDTGPCGPCTEIHFHHGDNPDLGTFGAEPTTSGKGWMEIWNLVFMQYERGLKDGAYTMQPLPKPCVDTGAGLERVSAVLQGKTSNYDTDLLRALVERAAEIAKKPYGGTLADDDVSMRVIADHARTTAFLIAENVFPDRAAREYVLRRVMRRAIRHGHRLGIKQPFLHDVAALVTELMGGAYPELLRAKDSIVSIARGEEERFRETIDRGLSILEDEIGKMKDTKVLSGAVAFKLYDTYGFPLDLTQVIVEERALSVDEAEYNVALEAQRARSEGSKVGDKAVEDVFRQIEEKVSPTRFVGYESEEGTGKIVALLTAGAEVEGLSEGQEGLVMLDATPFYAESGGQVGDRGSMRSATAQVDVLDVRKPLGAVFAHEVRVKQGTVRVGDTLTLLVDTATRTATRRNHSATHLLHWALRTVLGPTATQKGSLVGPDRLRFDFAHGKAVTPEELTRIEDLVNSKVLANAPIVTEVLPAEEAKKRGAVAMFGEKYGDVVRVLTMTQDSIEFCGGTHARALGEIGMFKVLGESGIAAGVRRIEAATGLNALAHVRALEDTLSKTAAIVKGADVLAKVQKLSERARGMEKEIAELKRKAVMGADSLAAMVANARELNGVRALSVRVDGLDALVARDLADGLRAKLGSLAAVLVVSATTEKVQLCLALGSDVTSRFKAGRSHKLWADPVAESRIWPKPEAPNLGAPTKRPTSCTRCLPAERAH